MRKALELASRGGRDVEPNPQVGCVIVRDGKIIGRGWHRKFGGPHAEVEALRNSAGAARGATMYVTLEPCNHAGKTPPCTDAIIASGIESVVVAMKDPNPHVAGNGLTRLRQAGIDCVSGVMEREALALNEKFVIRVTKDRPFVRLKVAQTLDGFIAPLRGPSRWFTSEESRARVHAMRADADGVLVGSETVRKDNPSLSVRAVTGNNPRRIILTSSWELPMKSAVFADPEAHRTIIVTSKRAANRHQEIVDTFRAKGITVIEATNDVRERAYLPVVLKRLLQEGIHGLLVEGGAGVFSAFLDQRFADRIDVFLAPKIIGGGLGAFSALKALPLGDARNFAVEHTVASGDDTQITFRPLQEE
ncbi:MAG: bifunctional diaminohydroxyphosphoribosylaminopyrimidine deaminase/5-amino-6-(5-phosphoribosylamino)uracil reductase RibD [Ignavibacteria bacterium]|nr:bifunctional diaminohydroxyphosphoribosylaminopyrimidine deaminase/5-amino-6-(5-phosphoribosylamino)uracil reductase RibD [Ignavibacteria bacterium]